MDVKALNRIAILARMDSRTLATKIVELEAQIEQHLQPAVQEPVVEEPTPKRKSRAKDVDTSTTEVGGGEE